MSKVINCQRQINSHFGFSCPFPVAVSKLTAPPSFVIKPRITQNRRFLDQKDTYQQNETDRLLNLKAVLKNGHYGNVFELSYASGSEHWFCKVCECPVMGKVYQHELGKRHTQNMETAQQRAGNRQEKPQQPRKPQVDNRIEIAPGEPIPPGFEGEEFLSRQAQIQERLDGFKVGPLVALEYLLEMQDYDPSKEPMYLCILCDKKGDPRTVLTHLASYNHISQYLQKHFPTCYRALAPYMTKQFKRNWQAVLQKIAEAIERKHGRLRPFCIEQDKFEKERMMYLTMILKGKHFSEQMGPNFVELVVHDELTKSFEDDARMMKHVVTERQPPKQIPPKRDPSPPVVPRPQKKPRNAEVPPRVENKPPPRQRKLSNSSMSSISSDEGKKNPNPRKFNRNRSPPRRGTFRRSPRRRSITPPRRRSPPRRREDDEDKRRMRDKERQQKMEEYNKLSKAIDADVEKTLKHMEKNPEKHPKYNEEWKMFWNRRYKELQADGKDASKYDFKPEWIIFWSKRMRDLSDEDLKTRKAGLRKRLGLPEPQPGVVAPISFKIGGAVGESNEAPPPKSPKPKEKQNLPMAARPDYDPEIIVIDDLEKPKRERSFSPWESESPPSRKRRSPERRPNRRSRSMERRRSPPRNRRASPERRRSPMKKSRSPPPRRPVSRSPPRRPARSPPPRHRSPEFKAMSREKDKRSRERSWERPLRESSFERDMRIRDRIRTTADLPWEREKTREKMYHHQMRPIDDYYAPPPMMRDARPTPTFEFVPPPHVEEEPDDGEVNLVSVLRLLTALEERLGSLGPKIIDLLAQALAMEKKEANSSETLMDNEINCIMFETVKEKLKGQLLAGLVDVMQERAFKKAIQKTASLIHIASKRKSAYSNIEKAAAVAVPGVGAVDKAAIARQLANALIAQGKTNVTQAELEQLINAVVGMAESSKKNNKPVSAADFFSQMTAGQKSTEEKVIIPRTRNAPLPDLDSMTEPLSPSTPEKSTNNMENLSDSDLQTLLQNFKDLSSEEQMNLINYLKKMEYDEPERVERLRKFVNLGPDKKTESQSEMSPTGRRSPFSQRNDDANPEKIETVHLDSEEDDYSYEDVVKAASKNIQQKELENNRRIVEDSIAQKPNLTDAKSVISNLMVSLGSTVSSPVNLLGFSTSTASTSTTTTASNDLSRALSGINMDNIASIMSNVQKNSFPEPVAPPGVQHRPQMVPMRTMGPRMNMTPQRPMMRPGFNPRPLFNPGFRPQGYQPRFPGQPRPGFNNRW